MQDNRTLLGGDGLMQKFIYDLALTMESSVRITRVKNSIKSKSKFLPEMYSFRLSCRKL